MSNKQPEALRLAAWLQEGAWFKMTLGDVEYAGRELRRLHAANVELAEVLKEAIRLEIKGRDLLERCESAIEKHGGQS